MKATVRFDDVFEGEDLPDIYRQVLEYLQNVVDQEDLEAFEIDGPQLRIDLLRTPPQRYGHNW
jgi:hypothetical protein